MYKEKIPWEANYNEASYGTPLTSFWNTGTITDRMPVLAERWSSHTPKPPMRRFRKYPSLAAYCMDTAESRQLHERKRI